MIIDFIIIFCIFSCLIAAKNNNMISRKQCPYNHLNKPDNLLKQKMGGKVIKVRQNVPRAFFVSPRN